MVNVYDNNLYAQVNKLKNNVNIEFESSYERELCIFNFVIVLHLYGKKMKIDIVFINNLGMI